MIGERIKEMRLKKDLTLEEVGKKLGISKATLQRYESGVITNIPSDKIENLAKILDCSPGYLMGWEDKASEGYYTDPVASEMIDRMHKNPELKVLFDASEDVSANDILEVANILKKLKKQQFGDDE
jgi:transcriptional regulator with XRE-family HTH domain